MGESMLICQTNENRMLRGNELEGIVVDDKLHQFCSQVFVSSFYVSEEMTPCKNNNNKNT